ncbi:hypothetical protein [Ruminococcus flavefaciens]|nr:hypothetical protein [Ruminococcus flavefaciens]
MQFFCIRTAGRSDMTLLTLTKLSRTSLCTESVKGFTNDEA